MKKMIKIIICLEGLLLDIFFPPRCPVCDGIADKENPICPGCRKRVVWIKEPVCKKCGKPLENEREEYCLDCNCKTHVFIQGKALWVYEKDAKQSLYRFKYQNRREYAAVYAFETAEKYGNWMKRMGIRVILPVPLHKKKYRRRGYNQAQLYAKELSRLTQIPLAADHIVRVKNTKPQKELNDIQRKNNLQKAFKIEKSIVQSDYILIVDDIYTTGSTIDSVALVLQQNGAEHIYFCCVSIGKGY